MSTWKDPVSSTPSIVQTDFGGWGQLLAGDGEAYCGPTALVMGLYWLYNNGFTQLAPAPFVAQDNSDTLNLELVIAGLMETSADTGTNGTIFSGITTYLSACGIPPTQYCYTSSGNPDLKWLAGQLAPNVTPGSDTIVLADFSVGWYAPRQNGPSTSLFNGGGHVLCPLTVDLAQGTLTVNNPWPPSFELVSQSASNNPQTVQIVPVPPQYTLGPPLDTGGPYSWVISGNKGDGNYAVLWGADIFAISNTALPGSSYAPAPWEIDSETQTINTNGGVLTVLAPLTGTGDIAQIGEGTLLLTNSNALTGGLTVNGGTVASSVATGTPLGTGPISLGSGALALSNGAAALSVQIASGATATLTAAAGGGVLQLLSTGAGTVTIGGNTDGSTPNLVRSGAGTLVLQPSLGLAQLGATQQVLVAGSNGNLPPVASRMVAPWMVGRDNDAAGSGAFLTYGASGFTPAAITSSASTNINLASGAVYQVVPGADQAVDSGTTAILTALEMDGGNIVVATGATLQIGSQTASTPAGLILNGGDISGGILAFGAAEAVVYAAAAASVSTVSSTLSGSGGLTLYGPGGALLSADNSASLSGPVTLNSGTLVAMAANGATGSGDVTINTDATLVAIGMVNGNVTVGQSGLLLLNGGGVTGNVTAAAIGTSTSLPGGTLQGNGTFTGDVVAAGNILSGVEPGTMVFAGTVTLPSTGAFTLRPHGPVDNTTSTPGGGWNALQIDQKAITIGEDGAPWSVYVDFSMMQGDPDSGNDFWNQRRSWSLITFATTDWYIYCNPVNGYYASGQFGFDFSNDTILTFTWTPAPTQRSPAELLALRTAARTHRTLAARKTKPR